MLKIRSVTDEDCKLLWEWANEAEVRAASFHSDPIPWEEHVDWFRRKRADPNCYMYMFVDEHGYPIGQVRMDLRANGIGEVAISVARNQRGRGLGVEALWLACERVFKTTNVKRLVAYVKPNNVASIRVFEKARFVRQGNQSVGGHEATKMAVDRKDWPLECVENGYVRQVSQA
jgi:RimJ/RimL family protein N-acetyltransferase